MQKKPTYEELEKRIQELNQIEISFQAAKKKQYEIEKQFRTTFERAGIGMAIIDNAGRFVESNSALQRLLGYSAGELANMVFTEFTHPEEVQADTELAQELIECKRDFYQIEKRYIRKDGKRLWGHWTASLVRDQAGKFKLGIGMLEDITERKQAEMAMVRERERAESERNRLQAVLEVLPVPVFIADENGTLVATNSVADEIWSNAPLSEWTGHSGDHCRAWWPGTEKRVQAHDWGMARALSKGEECMAEEMEIETRDGGRKTILNYARPILDSTGRITGGVSVNVDITEQKRTENRLREEGERMRLATDAAGVFAWDINLQTGAITYSKSAAQVFGLEALSDDYQDLRVLQNLIHEKDRERVLEAVERAVKSTGSFADQYRIKAGDRYLWIESRGKVLADRKSEPVRMLGISQHITDRKKAETALLESEKRFRDLVEMLPVAVFELDLDFTVTFANHHAFKLFGYCQEDLKAGINGLYLFVPQDRIRAKQHIARRLNGEKLGMVEYRAIKKDGSSFPLLLLAAPVLKEDQVAGFRGIIVDISDREREEAEKRKIADQFRQAQKMESIGRLAGGIAHDLNNLLSPIIGYCELLLCNFDPQDRKRESVNQMLGAGLRAKNLVHQLLAFGRKQKLENRPVNLNHVLADFEKLLRRTIRENVEIDFIISPVDLIVMADIGQVEQVIMNLSVNAQDAMPEGGVLRIKTELAEMDETFAKAHPEATPGQYALLVVSDTGCGMDEETREHLFEPFYSTKGDRGTGLGLATVYGIVKQHGGHVWVYSEAGKGSVFRIYLPIPEKTCSHVDFSKSRMGELAGTETILIAEDNEQVLLLAEEILVRQGYRTLITRDGEAALKIMEISHQQIDLLLTDMVMPQMNGHELFSKAVKKRPDLKVLFMSGYSADLAEFDDLSEEGMPFIQKPFSIGTLSSKVREILDNPKT